MLFGLAEFQEAPWHQLSGPAWRGRLGSKASVQLAQTELKAAGGVAGQGRREPGECATRDTFNMDESGLYYGQQQSLARGRTAGNKKDKKRMTVALTVNQLVHS
jgi:hypothetical protein